MTQKCELTELEQRQLDITEALEKIRLAEITASKARAELYKLFADIMERQASREAKSIFHDMHGAKVI